MKPRSPHESHRTATPLELFFDRPGHEALTSMGRTFRWAYGHYLVFGAAAMAGAGIAVAVDLGMGKASLAPRTAGALFVWPVGVYLVVLWLLHARGDSRRGLSVALLSLALLALGAAPISA